MPDPHAIATLLLTLAAFWLFSTEKLSVESSSVLILVALVVGFTVFPYETEEGPLDPREFFLGFGNDALIAIIALTMASQGLVRTGALAPLGRLITRLWGFSRTIGLGAVLAVTAFVSAFMSNTPQVALMIPILTNVAMRSGTPVSSTLMPMTFASQIGGMSTPIGTSLNLLVIGTAASLGVPRLGMFDFVAPAAIAGAIGLAYLWLVAPRLLRGGKPVLSDTSPRVFVAHLSVPEDSPAAGATVSEIVARTDGDIAIRRVVRPPGVAVVPLPDVVVEPGDRLVVRDTPDRLMEFSQLLGGKLYAGDVLVDAEHPLTAENQQLAELVVTPGSRISGRTLNEVDFDERYQLVPLAIHRPGRPGEDLRPKDLRETSLHVGDVLLVQGPSEQVGALKRSGELLVLDATADVPDVNRAPLALAIMVLIVLLATTRIVPVAVAALAGVALMVASGCIKWREAGRALDPSMILLTVAALGLSLALVRTGAAAFVARALVDLSFDVPPQLLLSGLMLLMALLANVVSNGAAAVIGTPIAVEIARALGLAPEPFVLAVLFGVNMGYATPIADNCNLLVYSAGGYAFRDFVRVGLPLTLIMWLSLSWVLPLFFPLQPT